MTPEEYGQRLAAKDLEIQLLHTAIDKSSEALEAAVETQEERDRLLLQVEALKPLAILCERECPECKQRYAEYGCSSFMRCYRCRHKDELREKDLQNRELQNAVDRANAAMLKHQKHNGALEIAIQEAHRDTDTANRLIGVLTPLAEAADEIIGLQKKWEKNDCRSTQEAMLGGWTKLIICVNEWLKVKPSEKPKQEVKCQHIEQTCACYVDKRICLCPSSGGAVGAICFVCNGKRQ